MQGTHTCRLHPSQTSARNQIASPGLNVINWPLIITSSRIPFMTTQQFTVIPKMPGSWARRWTRLVFWSRAGVNIPAGFLSFLGIFFGWFQFQSSTKCRHFKINLPHPFDRYGQTHKNYFNFFCRRMPQTPLSPFFKWGIIKIPPLSACGNANGRRPPCLFAFP